MSWETIATRYAWTISTRTLQRWLPTDRQLGHGVFMLLSLTIAPLVVYSHLRWWLTGKRLPARIDRLFGPPRGVLINPLAPRMSTVELFSWFVDRGREARPE